MEAKRKPIVCITIIRETFVVGKPALPGRKLVVPTDISESDARVLIAQGQAIEGDGTGVAAEYVGKAVRKFEDATTARAAMRGKLKPVSNHEIMRKLLEQQELLTTLLDKMGQLMFVEPEPQAVAAAPESQADAGGKPKK